MKLSFLTTCVSTLMLSAIATVATLGSLSTPAIGTTLISSSGTWENPVGGGTTLEYSTTGDESLILWGNVLTVGKSGLGYTGVGSVDISSNMPFLVGTLRHLNNPVAPPSVTIVDLLIDLNFADLGGSLATRSFTFNFAIDETNNIEPCLYVSASPCADRISFLNSTALETLEISGTSYTLELLGFSDRSTPDDTLQDETLLDGFISPEQSNSTAFLFGKLTAIASKSTPEPGAIVPLTLLGLYFVARRRG